MTCCEPSQVKWTTWLWWHYLPQRAAEVVLITTSVGSMTLGTASTQHIVTDCEPFNALGLSSSLTSYGPWKIRAFMVSREPIVVNSDWSTGSKADLRSRRDLRNPRQRSSVSPGRFQGMLQSLFPNKIQSMSNTYPLTPGTSFYPKSWRGYPR